LPAASTSGALGDVAVDDHNNTTNLTVPIVVLDQPNDLLGIEPGQGGVPGAIGRDVSVTLQNANSIYGIQFDYIFDETQVEVVDVVQTERLGGLGLWYSFPEPGHIIVLVLSGGLDPIPQGQGPIVRFVTDVATNAIFGRTTVALDSAVEVIDSVGTSKGLVTEAGYFTVDRFGDGNLDEVVNVGDCITIIAFIIERIDLNIRQFDAADINRDGRVTVADLQDVINLILQVPTIPGPLPPMSPVLVSLSDQITFVGDLMIVDMIGDITTEAAALQYQLRFNPENLEPVEVGAGELLSNHMLESNVAADKINGVYYHLGGGTFGPGSGQLGTFTFRLRNGQFNPSDLEITDFAIVDPAAGLIPSEVKGELPVQFSLNQNYPNPFNASTNISFDLPSDSRVELSIYDLLGRKIATLINGNLSAGNHVFTWDGRSGDGEAMATGVFFYRLRSSNFDETKKMLLVK
jgi:hypothetical protein